MPTQAKIIDFAKGHGRLRVEFPEGEGRTEQHHARACDINTIMAKYLKTGVMDHISKYQPIYGDVSTADFQTSMNLVKSVETEFEELPAYVRAEFGQDVTEYLEAMQTPEGVQKLQDILHPTELYERDGSPKTDDPTEPEPAPAPEPTPE